MRQNPRIAALKGWMQEKHLEEKLIKQYAKQYKKNKPYQHILIKDFLVEKQITFLKNALEKQEFEEKNNEDSHYYQTKELAKSTSFVFGSFHTLLSSSYFLKWLQEITEVPKFKTYVDLHGLKLEKGSFLNQQHDMHRDRKIAYIISLSSATKKEGGMFELVYGKKKSYPLVKNTLLIFPVSRQNIYAVKELKSKKDCFLLAGWFHG
ncbi:hypothetical protein COV16_02240 [Candidatus Woesearchaeota archaeon CG10_big_fil_rev_8_21_14_0_10_34_8]|nr:MAG: hypothetical protein COV16_02240 [Candidatus Woesearchaeota archaeon CG10_big_fil_rev_8_21_14_0_10_34_8]